MSDNPVLELLLAIRGDIGKIVERLDEHRQRLIRIELALAAMRHAGVVL